MIAATKVRTGERVLFSNREVFDHKRGEPRRDVFPGITADRILASCSIPLIYPWTFDPATDAFYWDGALVANTPLGAAIDMMGKDVDVPAEVVVVMMTPWWESGDPAPDEIGDGTQILRRRHYLDAGLDVARLVSREPENDSRLQRIGRSRTEGRETTLSLSP